MLNYVYKSRFYYVNRKKIALKLYMSSILRFIGVQGINNYYTSYVIEVARCCHNQ